MTRVTVANTCTQLKAKLGVRTLPELMRIAIEHLGALRPSVEIAVTRKSKSPSRE